MENKNRSLSARLNPANLRFTNKIMLMVMLIVGVVIVFYFAIGLRTLKSSLGKHTGKYLEELTYSKAAELDVKLNHIWEQLAREAALDQLGSAGTELSSGFQAISEIYDNKIIKEVKNSVSSYYSETLKSSMPVTGGKVVKYVPLEWRTLLSQFMYTLEDSDAEELGVIDMANASGYSMAHAVYDPSLSRLMKKYKASDVYLVDSKSGYIVYSAQKGIDFGTNLFEGQFQNSSLSEAFLKAAAAPEGKVHMTDYSRYLPANDKAVCFMASPVFQYGKVVSVLILEFDRTLIDEILFDESFVSEKSSLDYALIGSDLKLRNNPREYVGNKENFLKRYLSKAKRKDRDEINTIAKTGSMALYIGFPAGYKEQLLSGEVAKVDDFMDKPVVISSKAIDIDGNKLWLITKINRKELLAPFARQLLLYVLLTLVLLGLIFIALRMYGKSFSGRLNQLLEALKLLTGGEKSKNLDSGVQDEVGATIDAYNSLRKRINSAEEFAIEMSEGNYKYEFKVLSENDSLGKSLNVLKDKLIDSKKEQETRAREDEIQNWINSGIAKFNDILRENNNDINILAYTIIENMIGYLGAQVGGIFLVEGENESSKTIEMVAGYAYDRRKYEKRSQNVREGLLGACYLEKKPVYLKELPEDYMDIVSGLGKEIPNCLYIVPLKVDENVLGLMEVASFTEFTTHQIELIDRVADSIAATFVSVRLNMKTATLLEESNRRAEEIAQQEEEMRQNLEEMQATQEELARLRQDDEKRSKEMQLIVDNTKSMLRNLIEAIPGGYCLKDPNGIIHLINVEGARYYGISSDRAIGKTDHELLPVKLFNQEHKYDQLTLDEGEQRYEETVELQGQNVRYHVIKKPFMMSEIGQHGILTIRTEAK